jgi:hypothetical protein
MLTVIAANKRCAISRSHSLARENSAMIDVEVVARWIIVDHPSDRRMTMASDLESSVDATLLALVR